MTLEHALTLIEKNLVQLPAENTQRDNEVYFAGYIEALWDAGQVSDTDRDELYARFGPCDDFVRTVRRSMNAGI